MIHKRIAALSLLLFALTVKSIAQTDTLRVLAYNVLYLGVTPTCQGPHSTYEAYLDTIVSYANPDIVSLEKVEAIPMYTGDNSGSAPAGFADSLLQNSLNAAYPGRFAYCPYTNNAGADNICILYYNQAKLGFARMLCSYSNITDFDTYELYYKTSDLAATHDTIFLYVTLNHTNSGSGNSDATTRGEQISGEMSQIESYFTVLPNMINMGDFNVHTSTESCYQTLVSPANASYRYYDPPFYPDAAYSYPADWDDNPGNYASDLTVSTRSSSSVPNSCSGSSGGGKSWYDHIFLSANIINSANRISYLPNTFRVIGNDGNRTGIAVNASPANTSAPASVVNEIFQMSEHYPIALNLLVNKAPFPTVAVSGADTICSGAQATLSFNGLAGSTLYYWNGATGDSAGITLNAAGTATVSVSPAVTATYSLTSVYAGGASYPATSHVTVYVKTAGNITGPTLINSGDNVALGSTGTTGGAWSSSAPAIASVASATGVVTGIALGSATITYTAPGCGSLYAATTMTVTGTPIDYIWTGAAGNNTWGAAANWTSGIAPTPAGCAQYSVAGTSTAVGIATSTASVGAIDVATGRTAAVNINSSVSGGTTLTLNGADIYSTPNTVLSNANVSASSYTVAPLNIAAGTYPLNIAFNNSSPVILGGTGVSNTNPSNIIDITGNITSSGGPITYLGNGAWNGTSGNNGGILQLGGANTFTTPVIVGNADGSSCGILELDVTSAINNAATNTITINNNSQLYLAAAANAIYATSATTLYLNGLGNNTSLTGNVALFNLNSGYTWPGAIVLASNAGIGSNGSGATFTLSGPITGPGALLKAQGKGALILAGTGNSWSGGTSVSNGILQVNAGSALGTGALSIAAASTKTAAVILNNATQTVNGLSSAEAGTTSGVGNTLTLNGTALTINQATDGVYGTGTGSADVIASIITGTGSIIKTGAANLVLTSPGHTFSGGLTVTGGGVIFNPTSNYTVSLTSCPVTLNGGTLGTYAESGTYSVANGTKVSFSTMSLQDNSTIALDPVHTHTVSFASSSSIAWAPDKVLQITGWKGNYAGGTAGAGGRVYVGTSASALTAAQLSQIQFYNDSASYLATILSTGELVPAAAITITTISVTSAICNGSNASFTVTCTVNGTVSGTYSVQLSDTTGAFSNTTGNIIGAGSSHTITATIPAGYTPGAYSIRVLNSTPLTIGEAYGAAIIVAATPTVSITGSTTISNGTPAILDFAGTPSAGVTYTANGGSPQNITIGAAGTYTVSVTPAVTTTYSVTAAANQANGCSANTTGQNAVISVVQPYTQGNLVVEVGGSSSSGTAIKLDQYTTSGSLASSEALPSSGAARIVISGSASSEGLLSLSAERDRLIIVGYDTSAGMSNVASSSYNRVIGAVAASGLFSRIYSSSSSQLTGNNIRSGASYSSDYFCGGAVSGAAAISASSANALSSVTNARYIQAYSNALYFTSGSSGSQGLCQLSGSPGNPISTAVSQTYTVVAADASSNGAYGFAISPDGNTAYVASASSGILKFRRTGGAGIFALASYTVYATACTGIAVDFSTADPTIYATLTTGLSLIKLIDAGSKVTNPTVLATTTASAPFRGVMFAPAIYAGVTAAASSICSGTGTTLAFTGNPYAVVTYSINGSGSYSVTLNDTGAGTVNTGALSANTTYSLISITTPSGTSPATGSAQVTVNSCGDRIAGANGGNNGSRQQTIDIYPNPTTDNVTISLSGYTEGSSVKIINTSGQMLLSSAIAGSSTTLSIQNLPAGTYTAIIQISGNVVYRKITKR